MPHSQSRLLPEIKQSIHTTSTQWARSPRAPKPARSRQPPVASEPRIPFGHLPEAQVRQILKYDVSEEEGNIILRTLQQRRVSGSLIDLGVKIDAAADVPNNVFMNAINWLRENHPVDEQTAAQRWADQEASKLEKSYVSRAEKLGLYKSQEDDERPVAKAARGSRQRSTHQSTELTRSVQSSDERSGVETDRSALEEMMHQRKQKKKQELEERIASGEEQRSQELALAKQEAQEHQQKTRARALAIRKEKLQKQGMVSDTLEIPNLSATQRLLSPTLFAILVFSACYWYSYYYQPKPESERWFPDIPVSVMTLAPIIGINVLLFACWWMPPAQRFMNMFFTLVPAYPFAFSILGNLFSHQRLGHLFGNMITLIPFAIPVHEDIGRGNFVSLYVSGGAFGALISLWYYVLRKRFTTSHIGASGCVWAVMMAWAYLTATKSDAPQTLGQRVYDGSLWGWLLLLLGTQLSRSYQVTADVVAHLGGGVMGAGLVGLASYRSAQHHEIQKRREEKEAQTKALEQLWKDKRGEDRGPDPVIEDIKRLRAEREKARDQKEW